MSVRSADDAIALFGIYLCLQRSKVKRRRRATWTTETLMRIYERSDIKLLKSPEIYNQSEYKDFLRMELKTYDRLLELLTPTIARTDTNMRTAISPNERLTATLFFLASGKNYEELKSLTKISAQALGPITIETCAAIISVLQPYIVMPKNSEEWKAIAADFETKWNFNNCIGAIGGKHISIKKPMHSRPLYFNYKKSFSVALMALVNANCEFLAVEVGAKGRLSDAGIFEQSNLKHLYDEGELDLPKPSRLPLSDEFLPHVMVGSDAFPLLENLMTPYSGHTLTSEEEIFNYRLSRARGVVENALDFVADRFKVLGTSMNLCPEKVITVATACCYLHNFLKKENDAIYLRSTPNNEPSHGTYLLDLESIKSENAPNFPEVIRNKFCNYFNTTGAVEYFDIN